MISRRGMFTAGGLLAGGTLAAPLASQIALPANYRRIACEEAFMLPEVRDALAVLSGGQSSMRSGPIAGPFMDDLLDLGPGRISKMHAAGIDFAMLALAAPGVQLFEPQQALELARLCNDRLAAAVAAHPKHFAGMATLAPQAAEPAAQELERAVNSLGFKCAMINSSTQDVYVDDPSQRPIFEAAATLGVPVYIHPSIPSQSMGPGPVVPGFTVGWSYAVEAGSNAIRLIASGIFDDLPDLQIVLGHCGETLPMLLERLDNRYLWESRVMRLPPLKRRPSEYFRDNFVVTTSGMNTAIPVDLCIKALGLDNVLFAADWPFEDQAGAVRDLEAAGFTAAQRTAMFQDNPARVFSLD